MSEAVVPRVMAARAHLMLVPLERTVYLSTGQQQTFILQIWFAAYEYLYDLIKGLWKERIAGKKSVEEEGQPEAQMKQKRQVLFPRS